MQKAFERMNIKLHDVISSLAGVSGMAVTRAIVAGERSPEALVALCDVQIRRKKEQAVIEALRGTWADEHIFALGQALQSWDHYQKLIADCDRRIAAVLPPHDEAQPAAQVHPTDRRQRTGNFQVARDTGPDVRRTGSDEAARAVVLWRAATDR